MELTRVASLNVDLGEVSGTYDLSVVRGDEHVSRLDSSLRHDASSVS
jgi:hypothetical protein